MKYHRKSYLFQSINSARNSGLHDSSICMDFHLIFVFM